GASPPRSESRARRARLRLGSGRAAPRPARVLERLDHEVHLPHFGLSSRQDGARSSWEASTEPPPGRRSALRRVVRGLRRPACGERNDEAEDAERRRPGPSTTPHPEIAWARGAHKQSFRWHPEGRGHRRAPGVGAHSSAVRSGSGGEARPGRRGRRAYRGRRATAMSESPYGSVRPRRRYLSSEKTVVSSVLSHGGGTRGRGSLPMPASFSPAQAASAAGKRTELKYDSCRSSKPAACMT